MILRSVLRSARAARAGGAMMPAASGADFDACAAVMLGGSPRSILGTDVLPIGCGRRTRHYFGT
jgi:hypothetical protein